MSWYNFSRIFICILIAIVIVCGIYVSSQDENEPIQDVSDDEADSTAENAVLIENIAAKDNIPTKEIAIAPLEMPKADDNEQEPYLVLTESERLILATLIRLECGGSSYETKMAVASVVVNRMKLRNFTLRQAVFQKNVFSPARLIDKETGYSKYNPHKTGAYAECWEAVDDICANGPTIPHYVIYFRTKHYHSLSTPYAKIGSMYFSY